MKQKLLFSISIVFLFFLNLHSFAVPAFPYPIQIKQADGTTLTIKLKGDEFFKYRTTLDDLIIVPNEEGIYTYATQNSDGKFVSSKVKAREIAKRIKSEKDFIQTIDKNIDIQKINSNNRAARIASSYQTYSSTNAYPLTGTPKSLVILVNFSDKSFVVSDPKTAYTNLLNQEGYSANGATGSAKDYFKAASNGVFSPEFDVVGPFTLPKTLTYYGENDTESIRGSDKNPRQMVIDACAQADANGVDFAQYDTDNDGKVDNVFIYYAGYNEAENGPANTVWPHRWTLSNYSTKFDNKTIFDYACSSELSGYAGSNMCGIGTFAHEFGHVLGLPDYYATNNATHQTNSYWNIMDAGAYLNNGRTPPTYAAYDRFYLKWLNPILLKSSQNVTLEPLTTSNKAYLITQSGTHNLVGASPNPVEFFVLENRQQTGWDAYLPGHGMLVSHIYYSASTWASNGPNNTESAMGFDIVEADGLASDYNLSGDPFPGAANISSYSPVLRSGTDINRPLTFIKENTDGNISFRFMGGGNVPTIFNSGSFDLFNTVQGTPSTNDTLKIAGNNLTDTLKIKMYQNLHFEMRLSTETDNKWRKSINLLPVDSIVDTTMVLIRYNPTEPSYIDTHNENIIISTTDAESISLLISGKSTRPIYVVPPVATEATELTSGSFNANWNKVNDASGYYLTVYGLSDGETIFSQGFKNGLTAPAGWIINASTITSSAAYSGDSIPAIQLKNSDDYIQTEQYPIAAAGLSFYLKSLIENNGKLVLDGLNGNTWENIDTIAITLSLADTKTYTFNASKNYKQFKFSFKRNTGNLAIDDIKAKFDKNIEFIESNKWLTTNTDTIRNLVPNRDYYYKVKASDLTVYSNKVLKYENITDFSNIISIKTEEDNTPTVLKAYSKQSGTISVVLPEADQTIEVYNTLGQKIMEVTENKNFVTIYGLAINQVYILKAGKRRTKIIL